MQMSYIPVDLPYMQGDLSPVVLHSGNQTWLAGKPLPEHMIFPLKPPFICPS